MDAYCSKGKNVFEETRHYCRYDFKFVDRLIKKVLIEMGFWGFGVLGFWGFGVLGFWGCVLMCQPDL